MKHLKILLLVIMTLMVLAACGKEDKGEEVAVQFVEYKDDYAIYVSHEKKDYYKMKLSRYEKDFQTESIEGVNKVYIKEAKNFFFDADEIYTELDGKEKSLRRYY